MGRGYYCPVCLEGTETIRTDPDNTWIELIPCYHIMCRNDALMLLQNSSNSCPHCRHEFKEFIELQIGLPEENDSIEHNILMMRLFQIKRRNVENNEENVRNVIIDDELNNNNYLMGIFIELPNGKVWFSSDEGKSWLSSKKGEMWLETERGKIWFNSEEGQNWIKSKYGLQSIFGMKWLDSEEGIEWLKIEEGKNGFILLLD